MSGYRLYFMDGARHIRDAKVLQGDNDDAAIRQAKSLSDGRPMELWSLARLVQSFDPGADDR